MIFPGLEACRRQAVTTSGKKKPSTERDAFKPVKLAKHKEQL
jgi:hypothetical protein